jgi:hypothetical protein
MAHTYKESQTMPVSMVVAIACLLCRSWHGADHLNILPWSASNGWVGEASLRGYSNLPEEQLANLQFGRQSLDGWGAVVEGGRLLGALDFSWTWASVQVGWRSAAQATALTLRRDRSVAEHLDTIGISWFRWWSSNAGTFTKIIWNHGVESGLIGVAAEHQAWFGSLSLNEQGLGWQIGTESGELCLFGGVHGQSPQAGVVLHLGRIQVRAETTSHSQLGASYTLSIRGGAPCGS